MDRRKIPWEYESYVINYAPPLRKYTPDFKVYRKDGTYFFVEYKGYFRPEARTKMRLVKNQNPSDDIRFLFTDAGKPITKSSKTTYAMWAEKHGFPWAEGERIPKRWMNETPKQTRKLYCTLQKKGKKKSRAK